jgi:hypothetical protein
MRKGLAGAKPLKFCYWLFAMLGAVRGDEFHDLFPGTGIVTEAWNIWTKKATQPVLFAATLPEGDA